MKINFIDNIWREVFPCRKVVVVRVFLTMGKDVDFQIFIDVTQLLYDMKIGGLEIRVDYVKRFIRKLLSTNITVGHMF